MQPDFPFPYQTYSAGEISIGFLSHGGPRIIELRYKGSENLLAEMPQKVQETPFGTFYFVGGHRLWAAPEEMPLTYLPDDTGLKVREHSDGFSLLGDANHLNGLQKEIQVSVDPMAGRISLRHMLRNSGQEPFTCAPWSITMLRPGGKAYFPISAEMPNPDGLLPDRKLILWPYTRWDDPRIDHKGKVLTVDMRTGDPHPAKLGSFNGNGCLSYWLEGVLFTKRTQETDPGNYPDFGCNAETYFCEDFIELEALGRLRELQPGDEISLEEAWTLEERPEPAEAEWFDQVNDCSQSVYRGLN